MKIAMAAAAAMVTYFLIFWFAAIVFPLLREYMQLCGNNPQCRDKNDIFVRNNTVNLHYCHKAYAGCKCPGR